MPISCDVEIVPLTQHEFSVVDYEIMELAFALHNELGRFCDERVYEAEMRYRCVDRGFEAVSTQVPIRLTHSSFTKMLYADLLINGGALYELKTVDQLAAGNHTQTLTYLMLMGPNHGKLINWRPSSLQHEFVSTRLTPERRRQYRTDRTRWRAATEGYEDLYEVIVSLLSDWGSFLQTSLYMQAIACLHQNVSEKPQSVDIVINERVVGSQHMHLIGESSGVVLSSSTKKEHYEVHLYRLLQHTKLHRIQWINVAHHDISFVTLENPNVKTP